MQTPKTSDVSEQMRNVVGVKFDVPASVVVRMLENTVLNTSYLLTISMLGSTPQYIALSSNLL